jgi:Flp pilus assembly protein TadB
MTVVGGGALWLGASLLLAFLRTVQRPSLATLLRPYLLHTNDPLAATASGHRSTLRAVLVVPARDAATTVASAVGIGGDATHRLDRIASPEDTAGFRTRQGLIVLGTCCAIAVATAALRWPAASSLLATAVGGAASFVVVEQILADRSRRWQRDTEAQLPVIAEQIALLLGAGWSVSGAIARLAERTNGPCATDLRRVGQRVRQGLSESEALEEWARRADVPSVRRLVAVLDLDRETTDLGRLIAEEARTSRQEATERLVARLDRRSQQVWIPVTVATLVPGTVFLAIPFLAALQQLAG